MVLGTMVFMVQIIVRVVPAYVIEVELNPTVPCLREDYLLPLQAQAHHLSIQAVNQGKSNPPLDLVTESHHAALVVGEGTVIIMVVDLVSNQELVDEAETYPLQACLAYYLNSVTYS